MDYRDRWGGGLTLRRLAVLIRHLPGEAALWAELGGEWWSRTDALLDDLRMAVLHAGGAKSVKPHPGRERSVSRSKRPNPEKLAAARARAAKRQADIAAGLIP